MSIVDQRNELIELLEEQKEASSIYDSSTDFDISDYRDSEQSTWSLQEKKFPLNNVQITNSRLISHNQALKLCTYVNQYCQNLTEWNKIFSFESSKLFYTLSLVPVFHLFKTIGSNHYF